MPLRRPAWHTPPSPGDAVGAAIGETASPRTVGHRVPRNVVSCDGKDVLDRRALQGIGDGAQMPLGQMQVFSRILALEKTPIPICSQAASANAARSNPFPTRPCGTPVKKPLATRASLSGSALIACAIASPLIGWRRGRICAPFRFYWVMVIWRRQLHTATVTFAPCFRLRTKWCDAPVSD